MEGLIFYTGTKEITSPADIKAKPKIICKITIKISVCVRRPCKLNNLA